MRLYDIMCTIDSELSKLRSVADVLWLMRMVGEDKTTDVQLCSLGDCLFSLDNDMTESVRNLAKLSNDIQDYLKKEKETKQEVQKNG